MRAAVRRAAAPFLALLAASAGPHGAPAAADATARGPVVVLVDRVTSEIVPFDSSFAGEGPYHPSVLLSVRILRCPAGTSGYLQQLHLVQDGERTWPATSAHGVGEFSCTGEPVTITGFWVFSPTLHPGPATAYVTVTLDGTTAADQTVRVRVPGA